MKVKKTLDGSKWVQRIVCQVFDSGFDPSRMEKKKKLLDVSNYDPDLSRNKNWHKIGKFVSWFQNEK